MQSPGYWRRSLGQEKSESTRLIQAGLKRKASVPWEFREPILRNKWSHKRRLAASGNPGTSRRWLRFSFPRRPNGLPAKPSVSQAGSAKCDKRVSEQKAGFCGLSEASPSWEPEATQGCDLRATMNRAARSTPGTEPCAGRSARRDIGPRGSHEFALSLENRAHDAAFDPQRGAINCRREWAGNERNQRGDFIGRGETLQKRAGPRRVKEFLLYLLGSHVFRSCHVDKKLLNAFRTSRAGKHRIHRHSRARRRLG